MYSQLIFQLCWGWGGGGGGGGSKPPPPPPTPQYQSLTFLSLKNKLFHVIFQYTLYCFMMYTCMYLAFKKSTNIPQSMRNPLLICPSFINFGGWHACMLYCYQLCSSISPSVCPSKIRKINQIYTTGIP